MKDKNEFIELGKLQEEIVTNENVIIWPADADEDETKELLKGE